MGYNLVNTDMGDEGGFYVMKFNWKISQIYMRKLIIIQVAIVFKMLSTFDIFAANAFQLQKSIYDGQ